MVEFTVNDKATVYSAAIITAVTEAAKDIGGPDINAAIAALADAQAYIIASIEDRNLRRQAEKMAVEALGNGIAAKVNARLLARKP